jgi:phosphoglycolate phosphatase
VQTVLFDLDGTLADTAPDLAAALNRVLLLQGRPVLPFEQIRPVVSHGGRALIELGFGITPEHPDFEPLRQQLLDIYAAEIAVQTRLFPGMAEVLAALDAAGKNWGVVTNKPAWLTEPLLDALYLTERAACIVSGDTLPQRKPHPAPLLYACEQAGSSARACVYVGDAERDIVAGREAGMHTLVALFGYISEADRPESWGADALLDSPRQLLEWLDIT